MKRMLYFVTFLFIWVGVQSQNTYIAHRGASYLAPENTLASVNLAWELGADAVEVDIYLSADNRLMVIHDPDTKRVSSRGQNFKIAESSSGQLRALDVGSFKSEQFTGEKIPFFEEVLATLPNGKFLVVEIKSGKEVFPFLKQAVDKSGKSKQLVFISFGWETILAAHQAFPENRCYYLRMNPIGLTSKMKKASEAGLTGVNLFHFIINKTVMKNARNFNLEVLSWTVDDPYIVHRLNKLGINTFTTNRPKWLCDKVDGQKSL